MTRWGGGGKKKGVSTTYLQNRWNTIEKGNNMSNGMNAPT